MVPVGEVVVGGGVHVPGHPLPFVLGLGGPYTGGAVRPGHRVGSAPRLVSLYFDARVLGLDIGDLAPSEGGGSKGVDLGYSGSQARSFVDSFSRWFGRRFGRWFGRRFGFIHVWARGRRRRCAFWYNFFPFHFISETGTVSDRSGLEAHRLHVRTYSLRLILIPDIFFPARADAADTYCDGARQIVTYHPSMDYEGDSENEEGNGGCSDAEYVSDGGSSDNDNNDDNEVDEDEEEGVSPSAALATSWRASGSANMSRIDRGRASDDDDDISSCDEEGEALQEIIEERNKKRVIITTRQASRAWDKEMYRMKRRKREEDRKNTLRRASKPKPGKFAPARSDNEKEKQSQYRRGAEAQFMRTPVEVARDQKLRDLDDCITAAESKMLEYMRDTEDGYIDPRMVEILEDAIKESKQIKEVFVTDYALLEGLKLRSIVAVRADAAKRERSGGSSNSSSSGAVPANTLGAFFKPAPGNMEKRVERYYRQLYYAKLHDVKSKETQMKDHVVLETSSDLDEAFVRYFPRSASRFTMLNIAAKAKEQERYKNQQRNHPVCETCHVEMLENMKEAQATCPKCGVSVTGNFSSKVTFDQMQATVKAAAPYLRIAHVSTQLHTCLIARVARGVSRTRREHHLLPGHSRVCARVLVIPAAVVLVTMCTPSWRVVLMIPVASSRAPASTSSIPATTTPGGHVVPMQVPVVESGVVGHEMVLLDQRGRGGDLGDHRWRWRRDEDGDRVGGSGGVMIHCDYRLFIFLFFFLHTVHTNPFLVQGSYYPSGRQRTHGNTRGRDQEPPRAVPHIRDKPRRGTRQDDVPARAPFPSGPRLLEILREHPQDHASHHTPTVHHVHARTKGSTLQRIQRNTGVLPAPQGQAQKPSIILVHHLQVL